MLLKVLPLLLLATPAVAACTGTMPPASAQRPPTVPYDVYYVGHAAMNKYCQGADYGCTYLAPTTEKPDRWAVVINIDVPAAEVACTLTYELAHMPPNYWADAHVETPQTLAWLAAQRP